MHCLLERKYPAPNNLILIFPQQTRLCKMLSTLYVVFFKFSFCLLGFAAVCQNWLAWPNRFPTVRYFGSLHSTNEENKNVPYREVSWFCLKKLKSIFIATFFNVPHAQLSSNSLFMHSACKYVPKYWYFSTFMPLRFAPYVWDSQDNL